MDAKTKALWDGTSFPEGALLFYTGGDIIDVLIRMDAGVKAIFGGFHPTHVAVSMGKSGKAICAWAGGPRAVMLRNQIDRNSDLAGTLQARMLPAPLDPMRFSHVLMNQINKPYDYVGLLGDPLYNITRVRMDGGPPKTFHCSSLLAWGLAGMGIAWDKPARAVTPQDLWNRFQ